MSDYKITLQDHEHFKRMRWFSIYGAYIVLRHDTFRDSGYESWQENLIKQANAFATKMCNIELKMFREKHEKEPYGE